MTYDLIIVSQSTPALIPVTQQCIDSARQDGAELNIIVIETSNPYKYDVDKIIEYNGEFNYNRALNIGLKYAKNEIHILANNDLIFHPGWSIIGESMKANDYHSASAMEGKQRFQRGDFVYDSYAIENGMNGWCIFIDNYVLEKIGKLDETMTFWYSDNLYALQLKTAGIKHGLFTNIQVDHLGSRTLKMKSTQMQRKYQIGELQKFNQRSIEYARGERLN
jgi:hypothetical protein